MKTKKLSLTYAGLRINGDSVSHCFHHGKQKLYFSKARYLIIGHRYAAEREGTDVLMSRNPKELGKANVDDVTLNEWRELEEMAEACRAHKKAARRAQNIETEMEKLLAPIRTKFNKFTLFEDRVAFERMILRMLNR